MHFHQIINAALSKHSDRPLMQKEVYPVGHLLQQYLQQYKRDVELPIAYADLFHYQYTNAIKDLNGKHTHWENVVYDSSMFADLQIKLIAAYQLLHQLPAIDCTVVAIDFCEYANSMPFRITLVNKADSYNSYFYIKTADASRIYGLELEQLLSPNRTNFLYHQNTLVEAHINGISGDAFLEEVERLSKKEKILIATEFICFNERSFVRLLGDMRSYNFVVVQNKTDTESYKIKAIDFDQQCYEGRLNLYLPQFYKENLAYVNLSVEQLGYTLIEKTRQDERRQIAALYVANNYQLEALLIVMAKDELSENYKILLLRNELNNYHHTKHFTKCNSMGDIVKQQLKQLLNQ